VQCEAGLVSITGTPEVPSKVGISIADIACGVYAYSGILTALLRRERTGEGASIEVSLFEALGEWMGFTAYFTFYGGKEPPRTGASHAAIAPYGPFECGADDTHVPADGAQRFRAALHEAYPSAAERVRVTVHAGVGHIDGGRSEALLRHCLPWFDP